LYATKPTCVTHLMSLVGAASSTTSPVVGATGVAFAECPIVTKSEPDDAEVVATNGADSAGHNPEGPADSACLNTASDPVEAKSESGPEDASLDGTIHSGLPDVSTDVLAAAGKSQQVDTNQSNTQKMSSGPQPSEEPAADRWSEVQAASGQTREDHATRVQEPAEEASRDQEHYVYAAREKEPGEPVSCEKGQVKLEPEVQTSAEHRVTEINGQSDAAEPASHPESHSFSNTDASLSVVEPSANAFAPSTNATVETLPSQLSKGGPSAREFESIQPTPVVGESAMSVLDGCMTSRVSKRYHATPEQLSALMIAFEANPSPSAEMLVEISKNTGMPLQNLVLWFKNRRARSIRSPSGRPSISPETGRRSYVKSGIYSRKAKTAGFVVPHRDIVTTKRSWAQESTAIPRCAAGTIPVSPADHMDDANANGSIAIERSETDGPVTCVNATGLSREDQSDGHRHHHHNDPAHDVHHHTHHLHDHGDHDEHTHHLHPHIPPHQHQDHDHDHLDHDTDGHGEGDDTAALPTNDILDSCGLPASMPTSVFPSNDDDGQDAVAVASTAQTGVTKTRPIESHGSQRPMATFKRPRVEYMEVIGEDNPCYAWDSETCLRRFIAFLSASTGGRSNEQVDCARGVASKFFFDEMQNGLTLTSAVQGLPLSLEVLDQLIDSAACKSGAKLNSGSRALLREYIAKLRSGRAASIGAKL
jgi:hypothetical protein